MIFKEHLTDDDIGLFWISFNAGMSAGNLMLDKAAAYKASDSEKYIHYINTAITGIKITNGLLREHLQNWPEDIIAPSKETVTGWFEELSRFGSGYCLISATEQTIRIEIFTKSTKYAITAKWERPEGYLGCVAYIIGKEYQGNDLHDGPLTHDTWHKILADIISYEIASAIG